MGGYCFVAFDYSMKSLSKFVVVDLLFNVLPIVRGSSVFVFVLLCITLCPF